VRFVVAVFGDVSGYHVVYVWQHHRL